MTSTPCNIAMIGLGVMGRNLALNLLEHGFSVAGYDLQADLTTQAGAEAAALGKAAFVACDSLAQVLANLQTPRVIALSVPAGPAVDTVISALLDAGLALQDTVIDTGNSLWTDTIARDKAYQGKLQFFSTAVSGGELGARHGPSLMASGSADAWRQVGPMWKAIAAQVDVAGMPLPPLSQGEACAAYLGPDGAGHYVKMVHNGIEYADMQLICEVYQFLRQQLKMTAPEIGQIFALWNQGVLNSYLMEISADILQQADPQTGRPLVEMILDKAGQKGTGLWTAVNSLEVGSPAPTIAQAVFARAMSGMKPQRLQAEKTLMLVTDDSLQMSQDDIIAQLHDALYCAKLCTYAQGFALMKATASEQSWALDYAEIARIWRAGCIIRAIFLQDISRAFEQQPDLDNLLLADHFRRTLTERQLNWRKAVANASLTGIAMPGLSSALHYFDGLRTGESSASLLQAQRDYFGAHSYARTDQPEASKFHLTWSQSPRHQVQV
ncbi:NADP-dependent phosphogluconate dehydrogenase [Photobacterium sp. CCB-ST2H9]|uniref:NADP-dependent phosphogluconate dehydrogenase n=1 Tax=Photobacterium sp. CCB-ST2H9 TaxID=2912855 RepID=UPI0020056D62|nr:NADP-dependent phosphogluconate dehydrogenase [Photobacterium sp. CCB-ST2H9]UTM56852.1 NADP-dependent phosphogluconate dehydrogenase [Photobacterium sp. CCB-ST2H9]